ncbi:MAG TPA: hypothetical protein VM940_14710 [Chthoniobacterales bacterium]|jgi:hypothetical protein|nr:hypothetical protein [Chthoniobacterales bacterium]
MKRRLISRMLVLVGACSGLFLTSCVTTDSRISQHPEMFQSLSASDQALVREGKVRNGMSQNAVYLAWGSPDQKTTGQVHGRPAETWVYSGTSHYPYPYGWGPGFNGGLYGYGFVRHHRHRFYRHGYDSFYEPFFYNYRPSFDYPERTVSFQKGRVVAFQLLYPPRVWN